MLVDPKGFNELKELLGSEMSTLIQQFEQQSNSLAIDIKKLLDELPDADSLKAISQHIHVLKGSAGSLYCPALYDICDQFSLVHEAGDVRAISAHITDLFACLESTRLEIRSCCEHP